MGRHLPQPSETLLIQTRRYKDSDWQHLIEGLKETDRKELRAFYEGSEARGLTLSVELSEVAQVITDDHDKPLAIGGWSHSPHGAIVWLLTDDNARGYAKLLTQCALDVIQDAFDHGYQTAYNHVATENKRSIRWLKRIGFKAGHTFEVEGVPFTTMYKWRCNT